MVNANEYLGGAHLKQEDFPQGITLQIGMVRPETIGDEKERKLVVYFHGLKKGLVMNPVNITRMIDITNCADTDDWVGQFCLVAVDPTVEFQGKRTGGLRVYPPQQGTPLPKSDTGQPPAQNTQEPQGQPQGTERPW